MKTLFLTAAIVVLLAAIRQVDAVDGIAVTNTLRWTETAGYDAQVPEKAIITMGDGAYQPGRIIRMNIANSAVASCDTIYKATFARFPVLSMDGQKVAFQRWSARLANGALVDQNLPNYISVMDVDGGNVRDLVRRDSRETLLDWPYGDWIYYTKSDSLQVWKVKWNDPASNTLAFNYNNPKITAFWRWDISADASRAMINPTFSNGGYTNVPHPVPFTIVPLPTSQGGSADDQLSCNGCISPSGKYIATFMTFGHQASTLSRWDPGKFLWRNQVVNHLTTIDSALGGVYVGWQMNIQRWSANSDKWMCLGTTQYEPRWSGGNQVLADWVDKKYIMTTHNPYTKTGTELPIIYSTMQGDFWVAGGPQGCYEDSTGQWISVQTGQAGSDHPRPNLTGENPRAEVRSSVRRCDAGMTVVIYGPGEHRIELFGADGRCIRAITTARGELTIGDRAGARGIVIVRIVSCGTGWVETVRLAR
jgi:hypothetical protein